MSALVLLMLQAAMAGVLAPKGWGPCVFAAIFALDGALARHAERREKP